MQAATALGLMAVASVGLGCVVAGRVLRPLHDRTATSKRLSEQNLNQRIGLTGPSDELKDLADTFDAMLGRLDAAFDIQRRFVANAPHELRTPLTIMRTEIDVTLADPDAGPDEMRSMAQPGGWVHVTTGVIEGEALLRVTNSGPVLRDDEVASLFEPFRRAGRDRTAPALKGAGLGLSIVRSVVTAHGGRVSARPVREGGLEMTVLLPARPAPAGPVVSQTEAVPVPQNPASR